MRISVDSHEKLYAKLQDKLTNQDTIMRESINPEIKLAAVLRYVQFMCNLNVNFVLHYFYC